MSDRNPLVMPSSVTRGPGPQPCAQDTAARADTEILRANGLPGDGQIWLVQVQGQTQRANDISQDCFKGDCAIIKWCVGNTWQQIEADLPSGGLSVPLMCEAVSVSISRRGTGAFPRPVVSYAAAISAALGSPASARLTRTIEATAVAVGAGTPQPIPPKATRVQFTFDQVTPALVNVISVAFQDTAGVKVGNTGMPDNTGAISVALPQAAATWAATLAGVGPAQPVVAVFEINP